jgi:PAS domain S-box-containing protein
MTGGFYKIGTLARLTGLSPVVIRNWERRYLLLAPHRTQGGHRLYTEADRATLQRVRKLLDAGRSIGEIVTLARGSLAGAPPNLQGSTQPTQTRSKQLDSALARSVLDALPHGIVVTDAHGRTEWINEAVTQLCGYTLAQLRGKTPGSVLQGPGTDRRAARRIAAALAARRPCSERLLNYDSRNRAYLAALDIAPRWSGKRLLGFVALVRDVTEKDDPRSR